MMILCWLAKDNNIARDRHYDALKLLDQLVAIPFVKSKAIFTQLVAIDGKQVANSKCTPYKIIGYNLQTTTWK